MKNDIDHYQKKFYEMEESFLDIANERYDDNDYEEGYKIESITSLIQDIKYGYISKD